MLLRAIDLARSYRGAGAPCPSSRASTSRSRPASSWRSSAPRARASRRCSTCSACSSRPTPGRSGSTTSGSAISPGAPRPACAGTRIGYVFQAFLLISGLSALDNVLLAARYIGRDRAAARPRRGLMERLGVAHRQDHYPVAALGRRAAARGLLPRRAQRAAPLARRRAHRQPRRRPCPRHPGRAHSAGARARRGGGPRDPPGRGRGRGGPRAAARGGRLEQAPTRICDEETGWRGQRCDLSDGPWHSDFW